ncbi:MAG: J domain-containing protein [Abditibacteriota bacterium]|nr:J domain-containing protein [Abditibacteriota bacterium]
MKDYYQILQISRLASKDEIKAAYYALARKYHPDINKSPEAEDIFREINEAYSVLKRPEKKGKYDFELKAEEEDSRRSNDNNYSFSGKNRRYEGVSLATLVRCLNKGRIDESTIIFHKGKPYRITGFDGSKVTFSPVDMGKNKNNAYTDQGVTGVQEEPEGNLGDALHFYWYDLIHSARGRVMLFLLATIIIIGVIQFIQNLASPKPPVSTMITDPMLDVPEYGNQTGTPVVGMPPNGAIRWYADTAGNIPVTVSVPRGKDYYYVIIKNMDTGARVLSVFLYKGKSARITMTPGNYGVYYTNFTSGQWTGPDTVGQSTPCARCNIILAVSQDSKPSVNLKPVTDNNSAVTQISYEEFIR